MNDQIILLQNQGYFSDKISKKLNIPKLEVDLFLAENFYKTANKKTKPSLNDLKEIIKIKNNNFHISFQELAKKYQCHPTVIGRTLKKCYIKFPSAVELDKSFLTEEVLNTLIQRFQSGEPLYKLAKEYNLNKDIMSKIMKQNNIDTLPPNCDINTFKDINSEEKAYWLGFLYADGYISLNDNTIELSLQGLDIEHLYKFKSFIKTTNLPTLNISKKYNRCRISISNKQLKDDLITLGCPPQKSLILKFPEFIDNNFIIPFIRGYFDGDGSLTYQYTNRKKDKSKVTISTSIVGTLEFITKLKEILQKFDIEGSIYIDRKKYTNTYNLYFSKNNSVKLVNLLYTNASIFLNRKYERYLFFKNFNNFAVLKSDLKDHDRAISVKAKSWIKNNINIKFKPTHVNTEIINDLKSH